MPGPEREKIVARTCVSILESTRDAANEISLAFDLSMQSVLRAALHHASLTENLSRLVDHPDRVGKTRRTIAGKTYVQPVGVRETDLQRIALLRTRPDNGRNSAFCYAAIRLLAAAVDAGDYQPWPAILRGTVMHGQRRPTKGGREPGHQRVPTEEQLDKVRAALRP